MLLVAVAFASLGSVQTPPLWIKTLGYSASEVWTVEISKPGIPVVTTKIQGAPVDLMFDTANMAGLSISTNKAKELNLSVVGKWEDLDSSGAVIGYTSVFRVKEMSVFGQTWSDQRATSIDDDQVHGTLFGYGLLGPKYLQGCIVTFDYQSGLVAVRRGPGKSLPGWKELKMVVSDAFPGLPLVHGKVNGRPLLMELDTGKSRCVVDPELDHELNFPITVHGSKI
ncbi:MAG TPA: aspartyl protease family protein, partial [Fimbriimonadaceae bacterium]|nr:aspartyl protease family protein [Fimbriimonadaceae bacterium]